MTIKYILIILITLLAVTSCGKKGDLQAPDNTAPLAEER